MKNNLFHISYILTCLFFITCQTSYGQSKTLRFDHINTEAGLPKNQVFSLYQDHVGFIWAGTGEGLSRYDGYRFKTYNDQNSNLFGYNVHTIYEDTENTLWVGTIKGLSKFNRITESFENFVIDSTFITKNKRNHVTTIYEDNANRFWIGTNEGLYIFDRETKTFSNNWSNLALKNELDHSRIHCIYQDTKKQFWVGTEDGVFLIFFNSNHATTKILHFTFSSSDDTSSSRNQISSIVEDKKGTMWFSTRVGLFKLISKIDSTIVDVKFSKIQTPFQKKANYFDMMNHMIADSTGSLWVGYLNGLYYLPNGSNTLESIDIITDDPQLKHNYSLGAQFIDKSGVLWLNSVNGIYKHDLNLKKFNVFRSDQSKLESRRQNLTWSILKDSENITWMGTAYGVNKLVWSKETNKYEYQYIPNNEEKNPDEKGRSVHDILELDKDQLLVAATSGLYRLNKRTLVFTKIPILANKFSKKKPLVQSIPTKMCWGENNIIWMGTKNGLLKYDTKKKTFKGYNLPAGIGLRGNNRVDEVYLDEKKRLWIGTHHGINVFLPEEEKFYPLKFEANINLSSVWTIYSPKDGTIWFATWGSGLYHLIPKGNKLSLEDGYDIEEYHVKDGLSNEYIYSILPDEEGNLWMSTNLGISKLNPSTKLFENYTANDGLQSNEFNSGAFFKANDGEMFFGGPSGINSFYPSEVSQNKIVPNVVITRLTVNNKNVIIPRFNPKKNSRNKIILKYDQTPIKFDFSALSFNNSSKNKYLIKLENYDDSWINLDNHTTFTLSKLPPGDYTFKVKGSNSDGYWNEEAAILDFTITPPFWQTWLFYSLCGFFVTGMFYMVFKVRLHQIQLKTEKIHFEKQSDIKTVMLKEIHHRVKNNLQVINSLLKLQSHQVEDEKVIEMFEESQHRVISIAHLHEKLYQSVDLKHVNMQEHFTLLISELVKDYEVGIDISLDIKIETVDLGIETLVPLGLIINEVITNSLKYAFKNRREGTIIVHLKQLKGKKHKLIIGDDGIGLKPDEKSTGLGAELIQIFTEQLEGTIERLDVPGTQFKIVFEKIDKN